MKFPCKCGKVVLEVEKHFSSHKDENAKINEAISLCPTCTPVRKVNE